MALLDQLASGLWVLQAPLALLVPRVRLVLLVLLARKVRQDLLAALLAQLVLLDQQAHPGQRVPLDRPVLQEPQAPLARQAALRVQPAPLVQLAQPVPLAQPALLVLLAPLAPLDPLAQVAAAVV